MMRKPPSNEDIINAYKTLYEEWTSISVTYCEPYALGGYVAVVSAIDEDEEDVEEACYINKRGKIMIFQTTRELFNLLESLASFRGWFFEGNGIAAIAFIFLLVATVLLALVPLPNPAILSVVGQVLTLAAGFFFAKHLGNRQHD